MLSCSSCIWLWDPMDCRPPGSFIHGIFQARILECVVMPFSRGSLQARDRTCFSCISGKFFTTEPPGNPQLSCYIKKSNGLSCSLNRFFYPCMILQHHELVIWNLLTIGIGIFIELCTFPNVKSILLYKKVTVGNIATDLIT